MRPPSRIVLSSAGPARGPIPARPRAENPRSLARDRRLTYRNRKAGYDWLVDPVCVPVTAIGAAAIEPCMTQLEKYIAREIKKGFDIPPGGFNGGVRLSR